MGRAGNPPVPSWLGCGGLLLFALAAPSIALIAAPDAGLIMGDEGYALGEVWWLITPLAVVSILAVFRLAYGHRDWLAPIVSAVWLGVGAAFAIQTKQYSLLALTALMMWLLTSGTWSARRQAAEDEGNTES